MTKPNQSCPRCSGKLQKLSGFEVCAQCGYSLGSQSLGSIERFDKHLDKIDYSADAQARPFRGGYKRRRTPLNFEDD